MVHAHNISYSYGLKPLFEQVSFTIGDNTKVGLVGQNGAGKTTLLNLLAGNDETAHGTITIHGTVALVPQEVKRDTKLEAAATVNQYVNPQGSIPIYELSAAFTAVELEGIDLNHNPSLLSGGQKTKLALIRALLSHADILLLDEPTNFLDQAGKQWVMHFLSRYKGTVVLVSHDLQLMDSALDKILAVNSQTRNIDEYKGNYSAYLRLKKERDALLKRQIVNEQKHITRMEKSLQGLMRFTSGKKVRQRVMMQRRIERMKTALPDMPQDIQKIKLNLPEPAWVGELPLWIHEVSKSYDSKPIVHSLDFVLHRGERIALIGPNGAGKSTFIKIIMGKLKPDKGSIEYDDKIKIGYYSQEFETFDETQTLLDFVREVSKQSEGVVRPFLARFMFMGKKVFQKIGTLSGGEKTRLAMALLLLQNYNTLLLDEPTTYLDLLSQRIILDALKLYKGAIIVVSHTEDFIKELKPHRALILPEQKITLWNDDFLNKVGDI